MADTPTMQFNCPKCQTPGSMPMPEGGLMTNQYATVGVWPSKYYTCPECRTKFLTVLTGIQWTGQVWALKEYEDRTPAGLVIPNGPVPRFPSGN